MVCKLRMGAGNGTTGKVGAQGRKKTKKEKKS